MKFSLLIFSLNERESMQVILPRIKKEWVDEVLVVDGNSTDGSKELAESLGFKVLTQKRPQLQGAYLDALEVVTGDIIIPFSPDGNSLPEAIPKLVAKMKEGNYDMVVASRYLDGAKSEDDSLMTGFGNWLFTAMINVCFGSHYTDSLVMFRAWKRELIDKEVNVAGFEPYMAIKCAREKRPTAEIPADEPARIGGPRKVPIFTAGILIPMMIFKEYFASLRERLGR